MALVNRVIRQVTYWVEDLAEFIELGSHEVICSYTIYRIARSTIEVGRRL